MHILLVEDDQFIAETLVDNLQVGGHALDWLERGDLVLGALQNHRYDLLLLDLGLPGRDGLAVLRELRRARQSLPVIIISARDAIDERIEGLDTGADDYLVKPFSLGELNARLRALVRRQSDTTSNCLNNGSLSLDLATRQARAAGAEPVQLSAREFSLLEALLMRPGTILSRAELEEKVYAWGQEVESNAVEVIIHSLRKKLGSDAIKNLRGLGWLVTKAG